jgi:H+/Cl- antiporter ClcA
MIILYLLAYVVCGILTTAIVQKRFGHDEPIITAVLVIIWPAFPFFLFLGLLAGLLARAVQFVHDLTK